MITETLRSILGYVTLPVIAILALISFRILLEIKKVSSPKTKFVIVMICIGMISDAIAEGLYYLFSEAYPSYADIFYVVGLVCGFIGLFYLYLKHEKKQLTFKDKELTFFTIVVTVSILFYLFKTLIIPGGNESSPVEIFLNFFYPIASVILFLLAFVYRLHYNQKSGLIFYIMIDRFVSYIGDMLLTYYSWNETYGIAGVLSDTSYLVGYLFLLLGFLIFYKKLTDKPEEANLL